MRLVLFLLACSVSLAACAPFPELDAAGPVKATPPELVPMDDILAQAAATGTDPGPALAARAAALKARAAAISAAP
ncbi:MAG: hypothetical protein U1E58_03010 [Tabrizicola sp.]